MNRKLKILFLSSCLGASFGGVVFADEHQEQASGLPPLAEDGEVAAAGTDVMEPLRDEEMFGVEVPEDLIEPELEEGEVVERATRSRLSGYAAYSAKRLPARAVRVPMARQIQCNDRVVNRSVSAYPLARKLHGNNEMQGPVDILIEGETEHTNGRVFVRGYVKMSDKGYGSIYQHTFDQAIFDVSREAPGCRITGVSFHNYDKTYIKPEEGGRILAKSTKGNHGFENFLPSPGGTGRGQNKWQLFSSASCRGDAKGADAGKIGCNRISVRPLKVHLAPMQNGKACQRVQFSLPGQAMKSMYNRGFRDVYPVRRIRGDANVKGKVSTTAIARIAWDANRVRLYHRVRMQENGGDRTTYDSASTSNLIVAALDAPGCKIKNVSGGALAGQLRFVGDNQRWQGNGYSVGSGGADTGTGLLRYVRCRTNAGGNDDQKIGCTNFGYRTRFLNIDFE